MKAFLSRFGQFVLGVLSGFDRLFFRGTLRRLSYPAGLQEYLSFNRILLKDFGRHSEQVTAQLEEASLRQARQLGREIRYLNSAQVRKEDVAREIAARDHIKQGLICVLRSVDPCMSFQIRGNHDTKRLQIHYRQRKCVHLYHYQIHPLFGFMHARIQTWFPFRIYVCLNGREWLARQMDQARLKYRKRDNSFIWLEDVAATQALFDQQRHVNWPTLLGELAESLNPVHAQLLGNFPSRYYWSVTDSEWASDAMFCSRAAVQAVYPRLVRYAITTFGAADVLRFLGQALPVSGQIPHRFRGAVVSNLKERPEGIRVKHWVNQNSVKLYDKQSVLRVECTLRQPEDFKVYRSAETDPDGPKDWRPLRLGIADLHRRAEVSQAANERYLQALAAVHDTTPLRELAEPLCRPTTQRRQCPAPASDNTASDARCTTVAPTMTHSPTCTNPPRRVRALNPLAREDAALLEAVSRHEFLLNGLRNRDLRGLLFPVAATDPTDKRRQSAAITRKLRLLRAHGLIHKVPRTHRYIVSEAGRRAITALLAARNANADELVRSAA